MDARPQFVRGEFPARFGAYWQVLKALIFTFLLLLPVVSRSQQASLPAIGRIVGNDISVEGGMPGARNTSTAPNIVITNGNVITVHSGEARMVLAVGGEIDICGPAKLTILESGQSITVALDFGHVRAELPASANLRLFTPTIIATPLDIQGAVRDVTLGLELDDSLCVLATGGAIQLEHQFSGEQLIVPQSGEFFLAGGKLLPVAGKPGTCQCAATPPPQQVQPAPAPTIPEFGLTAPPETTQVPPKTPPLATVAPQPSVEVSVMANGNDAHPVTPPEKKPTPVVPPASVPLYTVVAPPLTFEAGSPAPPADPPANTFLLVREAHVDPDWEFNGHVDAPGFAESMQKALGQGPVSQSSAAQQPEHPKLKHRVWSFFKKIFVGNVSQD
jgi:hypothetical protein